MQIVNSKQRRTLASIFEDPVSPSILWAEIESLFRALGAKISEGDGSRVRVSLNGRFSVFHRPHPRPTTDKGSVKSVRRFLENTGVKP